MFDIVDLPDEQTLLRVSQRYPQLEISALTTWLALMRTVADLMADLDHFLAGHGLAQRRFFVLVLLMRHPDGLKVTELATGTGVSCATITGVVDRLMRKQLITRTASPEDRRAMVVKITEAGLVLLDTVLPEHYRRVTAVMTRLDETQRSALQTLLGLIGVPEKEGEELC